jgi:hypothetical protein
MNNKTNVQAHQQRAKDNENTTNSNELFGAAPLLGNFSVASIGRHLIERMWGIEVYVWSIIGVILTVASVNLVRHW